MNSNAGGGRCGGGAMGPCRYGISSGLDRPGIECDCEIFWG